MLFLSLAYNSCRPPLTMLCYRLITPLNYTTNLKHISNRTLRNFQEQSNASLHTLAPQSETKLKGIFIMYEVMSSNTPLCWKDLVTSYKHAELFYRQSWDLVIFPTNSRCRIGSGAINSASIWNADYHFLWNYLSER